MQCIYKISFKGTKYFYIGSTINFKNRKREHINQCKKKIHHNTRIQSCWNKYGEKNFIIKPILYCFSKTKNIKLFRLIEEEMIKSYWGDKNFMNISKSTSAPIFYGKDNYWYGKKRPDVALRNKTNGDKVRGEKNPMWGKKRPDLTKRNSMRTKPITLVRIKDSVIKEYISQAEAAKEIGTTNSVVCNLIKGRIYSCKGWTLLTNDLYKASLRKKKPIKLKNTISDKVITLNSRQEAKKYLNIGDYMLYQLINGNKKSVNGWILIT